MSISKTIEAPFPTPTRAGQARTEPMTGASR